MRSRWPGWCGSKQVTAAGTRRAGGRGGRPAQPEAASGDRGVRRRACQSRQRPAQTRRRPLYGVPMFLKDLGSGLQGRTQDSGSAFTRGTVMPATDPAIENFLRAGLVPLGRSTTPEFGMTFDTITEYQRRVVRSRAIHGTWSTRRAAPPAVRRRRSAAGIVPVSMSSDGGGSTRIPGGVLWPGRPEGLPRTGAAAAGAQRIRHPHQHRRRGQPQRARHRRGLRLPDPRAQRRRRSSAWARRAGSYLDAHRARSAGAAHRPVHGPLGPRKRHRPRRSRPACGRWPADGKPRPHRRGSWTTARSATGTRCGPPISPSGSAAAPRFATDGAGQGHRPAGAADPAQPDDLAALPARRNATTSSTSSA